MDVTTAMITVGISAGTSVAAAALFIWRVSGSWHSFQQKTKDDFEKNEDDIKDLKKKCEDLAEDLEKHEKDNKEFIAQQTTQWREFNRSLGQIEGSLASQNRRSRP